MYQAKTARNKALLMRRLVNMKLKSGTSVAEHTSEFQSLVNQLSSVEMPLGDEVQSYYSVLFPIVGKRWSYHSATQPLMANLPCQWSKMPFSVKKQGERTWAQIRPMPLSQRTGGDNKRVAKANGEAEARAGAGPLMAENQHISAIIVE